MEVVVPPDKLLETIAVESHRQALWIGGPGLVRYREVLQPIAEPIPHANAAQAPARVAALARAQDTPSRETVAPVYLRKAEAEIRFPTATPVVCSATKNRHSMGSKPRAATSLSPADIERLRQSGLKLDRNGEFWHEGRKVTHSGLRAAFLAVDRV